MATPKPQDKNGPVRATRIPQPPATREARRDRVQRLKKQHSVAFEKLADR